MNKHEIFDLITSTETKNINQIFKKIENTNVYYDIDTKYDIYCNNFNRDDLRRIISAESWLIILKFHENLFGDLNNRKIIKKNKNSYYKNYLNNFCYFDYLMTISNEIAIDFFISLIYDIIILKYKKNITINNNNFTKILSYLSLQKKNIKLSYNNNFPLYQIGNYHINIINRKYIYYI